MERLSKNYRLALLSNTDPIHMSQEESRFPFFRFFPIRIYSFRVGASSDDAAAACILSSHGPAMAQAGSVLRRNTCSRKPSASAPRSWASHKRYGAAGRLLSFPKRLKPRKKLVY